MGEAQENVRRWRSFLLLPDVSAWSAPQSFSDTRTYPRIASKGNKSGYSGTRSPAEGGDYFEQSKYAK